VDGIHEFIDILESLVHGGVTQIRHFIDPTQFFKHLGADGRRKNFAPARFEFMHHFVYDLLQRHETH
jgi:hypothetical protein